MLMQDCGWVRALTPTHVRMHLRLVTYIVQIRAREKKTLESSSDHWLSLRHAHFQMLPIPFFLLPFYLFLHSNWI